MKLWLLSDLHLEFEDVSPNFSVPAGVDVCICAGDLINKSPARGVEWLAKHIDLPTIYVAGNHEFYGGSLLDGIAEGRKASSNHPNIHFLENDEVVIGDVRFIGATLWTDFRLMGDSATAMSIAPFKMNDYKAIKYQKKPYKRLRPEMLLAKHMESRRFIEKSLSRPFDGKTVLVTHHGIHPGSVHSRYDGDTINSSYVSDMRDVLVEFSPDLCVHGHVHSSFDYGFHNTRIVVNPKGYFDENPEYVRDLIIDLDHLTSDHDPKV